MAPFQRKQTAIEGVKEDGARFASTILQISHNFQNNDTVESRFAELNLMDHLEIRIGESFRCMVRIDLRDKADQHS